MDELKNKFVSHVRSLQEIINSMTKLDSSLNVKRDDWTRKDVKGTPEEEAYMHSLEMFLKMQE